jgi:regulator of sigma E protease
VVSLLTSILAFIFVLGVLIFVHELGHFVMARRIGVRVLTFSLGFGPKLIAVKRGDTEYCISAIPLGGYVKMAGETPDEPRTGAPDEFMSKTKWQRFQVLVMGPVMNIALAILVLTVVLYQGARVPEFHEQPVVIGTFAPGSVAQAAGLQVGDHIYNLDGRDVPTWKQFILTVGTKADRPVRVVFNRDGKSMERQITPAAGGRYGAGDLGVLPPKHPEITAVRAGEPAAEAGLQADDVVLGAAGEAGVSRERLIELIKAHEGKPLELEIRRDGASRKVTVVPRNVEGTVMIGATISFIEVKTVEPGLVEAFNLSLKNNWESSTLIFEMLGGLLTRETQVKQLMGPIAIAGLSGEAAEQDSWLPLFELMAIISLNLGLINLMPIPVLDGGHIAILAIEGVSRRDLSIRLKEKMLLGGFVLLLMLMVTVIYNDLMRIQWIERLVPWR